MSRRESLLLEFFSPVSAQVKHEYERAQALSQLLSTAGERLLPLTQEWNQAVKRKVLALTLFQPKSRPDLVYILLDSFRSLSPIFDNAERTGLRNRLTETKEFDTLLSLNYFPKKQGHTSLAEIEAFRPPLTADQIQAINSLYAPHLPILKNQDRAVIANLATALATRASLDTWSDEKKCHCPTSLRNLRKNLLAYFDFYTSHFTENYSSENECAFFLALRLNVMLLPALGCFIPARLGITPSSAAKLYYLRAENSSLGPSLWSGFIRLMRHETDWAYLAKALPPKFKELQDYDPEMDAKAALVLKEKYKRTDNEKRHQAVSESAQLLLSLSRYHADLTTDLLKGSPRTIDIILPDKDLPFTRLKITCQNKLTLMLLLEGPETSLLLEINKEGRLFGMPAKLAAQEPHIQDLLLADILPLVLEHARNRYPAIFAPKTMAPTIPESFKPPQTKSPASVIVAENEREIIDFGVEPSPKLSPPDYILPPWVFLGKQAVISVQEKPLTKFTVINLGQETIEEMIKGSISPEDAKRIMQALKRFENGYGNLKQLSLAKGWSIKVGKWRILLDHLGGNEFEIKLIEKRADIFKVRQRQRIPATV